MLEIRPQVGPQEAFLSTPADIAFYGGAAGGGKTYALLLEPLRHIATTNGFGAVIFRRESPQITNEGGLWDTAETLYQPLGANPRQAPVLDWRFGPHGNSIKFSHMQHEGDRFNWQGSQIPLICFDELTHFTRSQFFYMLSRNRTTCGVRPYIRATYNPVPSDDEIGGWIHEFVGWYLDDNGEYPDMAKAGIVRWFVNLNDKLHWFGSQADAAAAYPDIPAKSFSFIPSSVMDNKILLDSDPGYLANLHGLDHVDQERLLKGNHKVKPEAGKVINRDWFPVVDVVPAAYDAIVRFWDFAATEKKRKMGAATASVKMGVDNGRFYVLDMTEEWIGPAEIDGHVVAVAGQDGRQIPIRWEEEGGSSGKRVTFAMVQQLAGFDAAGVRPTGDKLQRLTPLAAQARVGNVHLLRASWNDRFLAVMHATPDGLWDVRDAASGCLAELTATATGGVVIDEDPVEISPY